MIISLMINKSTQLILGPQTSQACGSSAPLRRAHRPARGPHLAAGATREPYRDSRKRGPKRGRLTKKVRLKNH